MDNKNVTSGWGGKREGAGRKKGSNGEPTVIFYARVTQEQKIQLQEFLKKLKGQ